MIETTMQAPQWGEVELRFEAVGHAANPYLEVEAEVEFSHEDGTIIRRPMFWDGCSAFAVRFASTKDSGIWRWRSAARGGDPGLEGRSGVLVATPAPPADATVFSRHGFWTIPAGGRNLIHADGTPQLLCADTAWALPWRATAPQVAEYAGDRAAKGFNATLLMTVQPDMGVRGPRSRSEDEGFDVGFEDLPEGRLERLRPEYFQEFDRLVAILVGAGIAPVYQPIFHGYGWKGGGVAGAVVSSADLRRYCRYLVARYGARPAIWLVGADGPATDLAILDQLDAAGSEIEEWDAYAQPTGLHYAPHALNDSHQEKAWLDFQWCQTGHHGEHMPERVAVMRTRLPAKAVANGEPTYENIGRPGNASGWWQGHEAWCNLTAGGTMGTVYGAGSLWQWRLHADEPGHQDWCVAANAGWREALHFPGSIYPGILARIFRGLPFAGMEPDNIRTHGRRAVVVPGKLLVVYLAQGGEVAVLTPDVPRNYRVYNPMTGGITGSGRLSAPDQDRVRTDTDSDPRVVVFCDQFPRP